MCSFGAKRLELSQARTATQNKLRLFDKPRAWLRVSSDLSFLSGAFVRRLSFRRFFCGVPGFGERVAFEHNAFQFTFADGEILICASEDATILHEGAGT